MVGVNQGLFEKSMLIFGAGRMGLSHGAMAGLLDPNIKMTFIDLSSPNRIFVNLLTGREIRCVRSLKRSDVDAATHAIISTPPKIHQVNFDFLTDAGFSGRLLIEKPVSVSVPRNSSASYVMSGYVLQHSALWQRLLTASAGLSELSGVHIELETNQAFHGNAKGWRSVDDQASISFLNEFGSHCIDLFVSLTGKSELVVKSVEIDRLEICAVDNFEFKISLIGNSNKVRKSVYRVWARDRSKCLFTDFYSFTEIKKGKTVCSETLASMGASSSAYLRGQEFAHQMQFFLSDKTDDRHSLDRRFVVDEALESLARQLIT
ncbi:hypothetical protein N9Y68_05375 [Luminiphilus sp.]|nr:hypothetical protein [Luminiphilus sp.]